jgi:hypothetical protein
VVVGDAAPPGGAQLRDRLLPDLPAARPAADGEERAGSVAEREGVERDVADLEEHAANLFVVRHPCEPWRGMAARDFDGYRIEPIDESGREPS